MLEMDFIEVFPFPTHTHASWKFHYWLPRTPAVCVQNIDWFCEQEVSCKLKAGMCEVHDACESGQTGKRLILE